MLSVVPTPIGNLRDITLRALDALKAADLVVCEDTRRTAKLLAAYEIKKPMMSFHEHSGPGRAAAVMDQAKTGNVALVSDGGTPLISDPGFDLVREALRSRIPVEVLPGPCAAVSALVSSGLAVDAFSFFGFLPAKSGARRTALKKIETREETLIFYESPYRLVSALEDMCLVLGDREAAVARELTKKFEEISRGKFSEILTRFSRGKVLGEIVILVSGKDRKTLFGSGEAC